MGTYKKVMNANYSNGAVARYDFSRNILRRVISPGNLERNYPTFAGATIDGYDTVSLAGRYVTVKFEHQLINASSQYRPFSITDYGLLRNISFNLTTTSGGASYIAQLMGVYNDSNYFYVNVTVPLEGVSNKIDAFEVVFDFLENKVSSIKINGSNVTIPAHVTGTLSETMAGKTKTICLGNISFYTTTPPANLTFRLMFLQLLGDSGDIRCHFDFLGDTIGEVLTDKAKLIRLRSNNNNASYVSVPVTF